MKPLLSLLPLLLLTACSTVYVHPDGHIFLSSLGEGAHINHTFSVNTTTAQALRISIALSTNDSTLDLRARRAEVWVE